MSEKWETAIGPAKVAITNMLAEIESTRENATKRWQLALILPFVVGVVLIGFTTMQVWKNLKERDQLVNQKSELDKEIERLENRIVELKQQTATLETQKNEKALKIQQIENVVKESEAKGIEVKSLEKIRNIVGPSPTVEKSTPRVVIHIHVEDQRTNADQVTEALRSAGYIVPKIERGPEKVDENEVRFFQQEDGEMAKRVADILRKHGVKVTKFVFPHEHKAPPGQIEVWFATTSTPVAESGQGRIELVQRDDKITIVRIRGQLTAENASDFRVLLARLRQQDRRKFIIDLSGVSKIDEQGLRALVSEYTATKRDGGQTEVINPSGVTDQLMITKLLTVFDLHNSEGEALRSFKQ